MTIEAARRLYAEEVRQSANLTSEAIVKAFATVAREDFLGPGPWKIMSVGEAYRDTPDADPIHLYSNILVAIDAERGLNNGCPSWLAQTMQAADLVKGERVVHIGAGVGYYTAILAEIVGQEGEVLGIEIDEELAKQARLNLAPRENVTVEHADGSTFDVGPSDVIFVNAGASHLQLPWLDSLKPGGRLLVSLTYSSSDPGRLFKIVKTEDGFSAEALQEVYIYPCFGSRDGKSETALRDAVDRSGWDFSGILRLDPENADESCWMATDTYWFSRKAKRTES